MNVLDLFSGIGGFSLGLERTGGFKTVAFCEIDPYCQKVLAKHWPDVPIFVDVRGLNAERLRTNGIAADVICGGFPCKQTSLAAAITGSRSGLAGKDSGLFREMARIIEDFRPRWAIIENPMGVKTWQSEIVGSLEGFGYTVAKSELEAADLGAPHKRRRMFFVANLNGQRLEITRPRRSPEACSFPWSTPPGNLWSKSVIGTWRMDNGVPGRVDRLTALGNAVVPQVVEVIGRAILEAELEIL